MKTDNYTMVQIEIGGCFASFTIEDLKEYMNKHIPKSSHGDVEFVIKYIENSTLVEMYYPIV